MATAIIYYSQHHGNTKKLLDAIAAAEDIRPIDVTEAPSADLSGYDRIGIASGIYFSGFARQLLDFARANLPEGKKVFFIDTCGSPMRNYLHSIRAVTAEKHCRELGAYQCLGFDTFGPFKLIGGIAKGHPTQEEIDGAVAFYRGLPR